MSSTTTTGAIDRDLRTRVAAMQRLLDRLLADAQSPVGTAGTPGASDAGNATITVDRATLLQLRQQLDALMVAIAALDQRR
jgi:hypothetical protein